jgi:hypothetical protein
MKLSSIATTAAALLATITLASAPAVAGQRDHQDGRRSASSNESRGHAAEQAQPRSAPAQAPRNETRRENVAPRQESRQNVAPRNEVRRDNVAPRNDIRRDNFAPRNDVRRDNFVPRNDVRRETIVPRGNYAPRYAPRYDGRYAPRYAPSYRSGYYSRPYVFRPRFSIGFGIFAGYPVPYSYSYDYPVPVYGYGAPREVVVGPGSTQYGGITFEMTPYDADVYVDGTHAGRVADFDGSQQPLTLTPGTHQIQVVAPGYQPLNFDVSVQPGQIIPYRGDLQR